jgi:toxin ParE1/3/4
MNVNWSSTAAAQLQAIRDYLARSSPGYAQALAERIVVRTESLATQPLIGAEVPEYGDETIRKCSSTRIGSCIAWKTKRSK